MGDYFKSGDDPQKVVDKMLGDDIDDLRRERNDLPGEEALKNAGEEAGSLLDRASNWLSGVFADEANQPASDFRADQAIAREFLDAAARGGVSPDLFQRAQDIHNNRPESLRNDGAETSLAMNFQDRYSELLHEPEQFGLTGDKSPRGNLYGNVENGKMVYELKEITPNDETPMVRAAAPQTQQQTT